MTDNTQELDEILSNAVQNIALYTDSNVNTDRFTTKVLKSHSDNLRTVILDWHNKQVEEVLDRLEASRQPLFERVGMLQSVEAVSMRAIEAERNKLKEDNQMTKLSSATKSAWEALQLPLLHDLEVAANSDNPGIYTPAMDAQDALGLLDRALERLESANS